jgi:hypothetical protein
MDRGEFRPILIILPFVGSLSGCEEKYIPFWSFRFPKIRIGAPQPQYATFSLHWGIERPNLVSTYSPSKKANRPDRPRETAEWPSIE